MDKFIYLKYLIMQNQYEKISNNLKELFYLFWRFMPEKPNILKICKRKN